MVCYSCSQYEMNARETQEQETSWTSAKGQVEFPQKYQHIKQTQAHKSFVDFFIS